MSTQRCDPDERPTLRFAQLLAEFDRYRIHWVLTGSAVLFAYGADLIPNDLDVTPALDNGNLRRLATLLDDLAAIPAHHADRAEGLSVDECRKWNSNPANETNLDHLFVTHLGLVDVVPRLCGTYDNLISTSTTVTVDEVAVQICAPLEVHSRLAGRTRPKDLDRQEHYAAVAQAVQRGRDPTGLQRLADVLR